MSKHTKGPWFLSSAGATVYALHGDPPRNRFSAYVQAGRADDAPQNECIANARLMAAAPDLLEALQAMLEQFTKTPSTLKDSEARVKAHAAIRKATGEA